VESNSLGDRMKSYYENVSRYYLTRKIPVILRIDGKAFHTFTKNFKKPFDDSFSILMERTAIKLCEEIQGSKCAYKQSDEISILITDLDDIKTEAWFDYNIQKMVSVSASIATAIFNKYHFIDEYDTLSYYTPAKNERIACFDSRVFNIPIHEVENYFIWRQKDWIRNSIMMLARSYFSHKELKNKNGLDVHEMLCDKNVNWTDLEDKWKNGVFIRKVNYEKNGVERSKWEPMRECPIFTTDEGRILIRSLLKENLNESSNPFRR
jgi:tRNA(His) 5'-end guanylyltransferase